MTARNSPELLIAFGTRPEIIKMAPVIRAIQSRDDLSFRLLHTDQHYDEELSNVFFQDLQLPSPHTSLDVGSGTQAQQTAAGLTGIEREIRSENPAAVLALGDTNAVLSAALATSKSEAEFVHIEAGIRSFDRDMPEEVNRVIADQVSDVAFAPTEAARKNLRNEGIEAGVHVVGNTIVDACREHVVLAKERSEVLDRLVLTVDEFVVATIHRQRNTDNLDRLETILQALDSQDVPVVLPLHPRTQNRLEKVDFSPEGSLQTTEPMDYLDFLALLNASRVVVTDSGGVQEEASILEVPCLTVRPNTERPETIEAGVNELVLPADVEKRLQTLLADQALRDEMAGHPDLYGDGDSGERIADRLASRYSS